MSPNSPLLPPCLLLLRRPIDVLAFLWDVHRRSAEKKDTVRKSTEKISGHHQLVYVRKAAPNPLTDRDYLGDFIWRKINRGFVLVNADGESPRHPLCKDCVRASYPSALKIKQLGDDPNRTTLEYVIQPDFGGNFPGWATKFYVRYNLARVTAIQEHFQGLRGLRELGAEDGVALGSVLTTKSKAEKHHGKGETRVEARVKELMVKQKGLKELGQKHEWFGVLLTKIVANKLRPAGDSKAKLCNMSEKEVNVIGGALASCIAANLTAPAAVDEWILRYPAMGELERKYVYKRNERKKELTAATRQRPTTTTDARAGRQQPTLVWGANNVLILRSLRPAAR
jgi:hypothetical protein